MIIIGIITRTSKSAEGHNISIIYNDIIKAIKNNGAIPLGITLDSNYKILINICDGIIFQGGDSFEDYDYDALKYIYDINKPVLGICLGMQLMGMLFDGSMIDVSNHKDNKLYSHNILIDNKSKLYSIFDIDRLKVNSRHRSIIKTTKLKISALSEDKYIEAIEDTSKDFFVGVQWHPENMIDYSLIQNNIFKALIESCKNKL